MKNPNEDPGNKSNSQMSSPREPISHNRIAFQPIFKPRDRPYRSNWNNPNLVSFQFSSQEQDPSLSDQASQHKESDVEMREDEPNLVARPLIVLNPEVSHPTTPEKPVLADSEQLCESWRGIFASSNIF